MFKTQLQLIKLPNNQIVDNCLKIHTIMLALCYVSVIGLNVRFYSVFLFIYILFVFTFYCVCVRRLTNGSKFYLNIKLQLETREAITLRFVFVS